LLLSTPGLPEIPRSRARGRGSDFPVVVFFGTRGLATRDWEGRWLFSKRLDCFKMKSKSVFCYSLGDGLWAVAACKTQTKGERAARLLSNTIIYRNLVVQLLMNQL
jgi:hypothetical protein